MDEIDILMNAPEKGLETYLERSCGSDQELRARVDALLKADTEAGSFMDQAVVREDLIEACACCPVDALEAYDEKGEQLAP